MSSFIYNSLAQTLTEYMNIDININKYAKFLDYFLFIPNIYDPVNMQFIS